MREDAKSWRAGRPPEMVRVAGPDAPIPEQVDLRWHPLDVQPATGIDLRDRFRGVLIGGR